MQIVTEQNSKQNWLIRVHYDHITPEAFIFRQFGFHLAKGLISGLSDEIVRHPITPSNWIMYGTEQSIKTKLEKNWQLIKETLSCNILLFPAEIIMKVSMEKTNSNEQLLNKIINQNNASIIKKKENILPITNQTYMSYELASNYNNLLKIENCWKNEKPYSNNIQFVIHAGTMTYSWRPEMEQEKILKKIMVVKKEQTKPKI